MDLSNISKIAATVIDNTKQIVSVDSALLSEECISNEEVVKESPLMEKALISDFNSAEELNAKKVMSTALLIAKKTGALPERLSQTLDGISSASLSDEAISRMKVAYKIATGEIDAYDAADKLIDRATSRLVAVSDIIVGKSVDIVIDMISMAVATVYPPARPVVMVIKIFQPYIKAKVKDLVKKGIRKLNEVAKNAARKTIDFVKSKIKVSSSIISLFS
ncbi:MAG: hypothetical protein K2K97_00940 [Muribaculaceae bacterium]|nr:hypothetical protein [Muribaculaceae bacterium]